MKISKVIISLLALSLMTSCASMQSKNLSAIEGNKIIVVNSAIGQFFFTANGKEKVAEGYKFSFAIGNKDYAQYEGLSVKVRWGKNPAKDTKDSKDKKDKKSPAKKVTANDLKAKDIKIDVLKAGEWKNFTVVIPAKSEAEMEIFNLVVFAVDKISLASAE